jgi:hypothetical protein
MKLPKGTLQKVAHRFVSRLREELTHEEFEAMRVANSAEVSSRFCHSHDYCDADMIMYETLEKVAGISAVTGRSDYIKSDYTKNRNIAWALASKIIAENTIPEVE